MFRPLTRSGAANRRAWHYHPSEKAYATMDATPPPSEPVPIETARRSRSGPGMFTWTACVVVAALAIAGWWLKTSKDRSRTMKEKWILSNARMLAAAADQYYLEYGMTTVSYERLVGLGPTYYIKTLPVFADEHYPRFFTQGITITVSSIAGSRTITYAP